MGFTLHDSHGHSHGGLSHGHSHGGSHSHGNHPTDNGTPPSEDSSSSHSIRLDLADCESTASNENRENINVRAAFIHVLGDLFQSVGVLVAAYIIYYKVH